MRFSLFTQVMGHSNHIRIMEYFLEGRELDFDVMQIAEDTELSRKTVQKVIDSLIGSKIIFINRRVGRTYLFKLNKDNQISKRLCKLFDEILQKEGED